MNSSFKSILGIAALAMPLALPGAVRAQAPASKAAQSATASEAEKGVAGVIQDFIKAWNAHDAKALGDVFSADGEFVGISGIKWSNPAEVSRVHAEQFAGRYSSSLFALDKAPAVALLKPDVALVHWQWTISDVRNPDGTKVAPYQGIFTWVLVNRDGVWRVRAAQNNVSK